jgi:hypothetical protein
MRTKDKSIFAQAANQFNAWILVRQTNPKSLQYIGRTGYTPKPLECKAKTADADVGRYHTAGLVIDPRVHQVGAFREGKYESALTCWKQFTSEHHFANGQPFAIDSDPGSQHYGCVTFHGSYIHADYDLYDIILLSHPRGNLAAVETLRGQRHMRGPRLIPIMRFINGRIGVDMVQHGGEAQYADHSEQSIDGFGPGGEHITLLNELAIRVWYRDKFQRATIDTSGW